VLGHGAGGGVQAPDLQAAAGAAVEHGWTVALVEQPYRVAGRRTPPRAPILDSAWEAVCARLGAETLSGLPMVRGGRSSGARVACRTAAATGAAGVLCLAFPLQPPARRDGTLAPDRLGELEQVRVPVLVVQGRSDRFGMVSPAPGREVVELDGDHGLKRDHVRLRTAVGDWLDRVAGGAIGGGPDTPA
jgi:predicted alpha/beta-hydrolase family hydrolase